MWGPAHGGANEAVLNMLNEIGNKKNMQNLLIKRVTRMIRSVYSALVIVYKNFDPRAKVLRKACHDVLGNLV